MVFVAEALLIRRLTTNNEIIMIKTALSSDAKVICTLVRELSYPAVVNDLEQKLAFFAQHPDHAVLVYELDGIVVGFISVCFVPSLAVDDGLAIINYLAVDERYIGQGIGKSLEKEAEKMAWERHCDWMQVHCWVERTMAHGFYKSRGYREYPVFYQRRLIYAE